MSRDPAASVGGEAVRPPAAAAIRPTSAARSRPWRGFTFGWLLLAFIAACVCVVPVRVYPFSQQRAIGSFASPDPDDAAFVRAVKRLFIERILRPARRTGAA